jgi:hypothetical protein
MAELKFFIFALDVTKKQYIQEKIYHRQMK